MRPARPAAALLMAAGFESLAAPAMAQHLAQADSPDIAWWRVVGALLLCLVLAVGAAYALRRRLRGGMPAPGPAQRRLRLVESVRLSHQVDVCLVECDERSYLIATSAHGAVTLFPDASPTRPTEPR